MTFANMGYFRTKPGRRDEFVDLLSTPNRKLSEVGCLLYEVGTSDDQPDTVFVMELWTSAEAHRASLEMSEVKATIQRAMAMLTGEMDGHRFEVAGSPIESRGERD